jgi:hypothetical protein
LHGETLHAWVSAAPKADIVFVPWDGDLNASDDNGTAAKHLAQHYYGALDLSGLPATAFPITLRLLYDPVTSNDSIVNHPGVPSRLDDDATVGQGTVREESVLDSPPVARTVPIWTAFYPVDAQLTYNLQESVRAEALDHTGALIARYAIGASRLGNNDATVFVVNTPGADQAFLRKGYQSVANVQRLVPDSYAVAGVDVIWIDSATATDPVYTDAFWQRVLLGGTTVAGLPNDIANLTARLALKPDEPVLLGGLVAADSPAAFNQARGVHRQIYLNVHVDPAVDPFSFSVALGLAMHQELLRFSLIYLGVFVALQALVVAFAFMGLRGPQRVWLWLIVPGIAVLYAVGGIIFAHFVVRAQSDSHLTQLEFRREGWPGGVLLSHLDQIDLAERETHLDFSVPSRPYISINSSWRFNPGAETLFSDEGDGGALSFHPPPGFRTGTDIRSLLGALPLNIVIDDGKLSSMDNFSGAWLWDGREWHNLGPLYKGQMGVDWKQSSVIYPQNWPSETYPAAEMQDASFPSALAPLLNRQRLEAMGAAGDGLFLGVRAVSDVKLESGRDDSVASRRVVAYQFHLQGGTR